MGLTESELARTRPLEAIPTPHALLHSLIPNAFGAQVLKYFGDILINEPLNPPPSPIFLKIDILLLLVSIYL